ncbi:hypothetical protein AAE026_24535 [Bradyrhizobium sp. DN5]
MNRHRDEDGIMMAARRSWNFVASDALIVGKAQKRHQAPDSGAESF